jgi:single stranded DNA-binding protein
VADLNVVVLTGRLAEDPRLYATPDAGDVTKLRLAIGRPRRSGQQNSTADFVDVVVQNGDAQAAARYLAKGSRVGIRGRLQQRVWTQDGRQRSRLQILSEQVSFLDSRDRGPQTPQPSPQQAATEASEASTPAAAADDAPQTFPEVLVWADGGSRGNPGSAGYGVVITTPPVAVPEREEFESQVLAELAEGIGWATNNVAEYRGVIAGLERAKALGARRVHVRADSKLVIQQLNRTYKVNSAALVPLHTAALQLAKGFEAVSFEHVSRDDNQAADRLANQAMDAQGTVTDPDKETPEPPGDAATATASTATSEPAGSSAS